MHLILFNNDEYFHELLSRIIIWYVSLLFQEEDTNLFLYYELGFK